MKDLRCILRFSRLSFLVLICIMTFSGAAVAQQTPPPFSESFDATVKEKGLAPAAKLLIYTMVQKGQLEVAPLIGAAEGSRERTVVSNLLSGISQFSSAAGGADRFFSTGGKALASPAEVGAVTAHYRNRLESLDTDERQDQLYLETFPKKDAQIVELHIAREPGSQAPGDIRIFLFFKKQKGDVWRLHYGFGLITKSVTS